MYDTPLLYDIAFSYRDFRHEVDCLLAWAARASGRAPRSLLELAAGPADHAIEAARRGLRAVALDVTPEMCAYARGRVHDAGVAVEVVQADMLDFDLRPQPAAGGFDLAATMIASLVHVPTPAALVRHLRAVARHLSPGGVYIVEQPHPRDYLVPGNEVSEPWTVERDGVRVETRWGRRGDPYDPTTQVRVASVELIIRGPDGQVETRRETVPMKEWTATEMDACILASGVFEVAGRHGDLAPDAPFDASPESWRMITVMRRTGAQ